MWKLGRRQVRVICGKKRSNAMLDNFEPPPMDIAKREELSAYVARRKEELPDAWY